VSSWCIESGEDLPTVRDALKQFVEMVFFGDVDSPLGLA
jgi:hypothetical protein